MVKKKDNFKKKTKKTRKRIIPESELSEGEICETQIRDSETEQVEKEKGKVIKLF